MAGKGNDFEKLKRQATDLINDLHARKLAIPAGMLVVLIVGSMLVLPKSPAPPPPVQTAPAANNNATTLNVAQAANLELVSATPLTATPLTFGSANPFAVGTKVSCRTTKTSKPRELQCLIGSTLIKYRCMASNTAPICTGAGSTGATGASGGGGGGTGTTGSTGGGSPKPKPPAKPKTTFYVVDLTFDGKTLKNVVAGDVLPTTGVPIVFYAGTNSTNTKAIFVLADGVSVQGATADPDLGNFEISAGDEVVLTTAAGDIHQLQLSKLRKVTK